MLSRPPPYARAMAGQGRMNPQKLTGQGERTFIMGELGRSQYSEYIRITVNGKPKIDGTGPTPAVLIDKAKHTIQFLF